MEKVYFLTVKQRWKEVEKFGGNAQDALVLSLRGADSYTKKDILRVLQQIGWEPKDEGDKVEFLIATQKWDEVARLGNIAVPSLISSLKDSDLRKGAVKALCNIKDPRAIEPLIVMLDDWGLREEIISGLSSFGEPAISKIIGIIRQGAEMDWKIRSGMTDVLKKIGKPTIKPLLNVLDAISKKEFHFTPEEQIASLRIQDDILGVLEEIGDQDTIKLLSRISQSEDVTEAIKKIERKIKKGR